MPGKTITRTDQEQQTADDRLHEQFYQVVLHNDDHHEALHVVHILMQIFAHSHELAFKIMMEAHQRGKSIAEVEAETPARLHRDQLQSFGLSASLEPI